MKSAVGRAPTAGRIRFDVGEVCGDDAVGGGATIARGGGGATATATARRFDHLRGPTSVLTRIDIRHVTMRDRKSVHLRDSGRPSGPTVGICKA